MFADETYQKLLKEYDTKFESIMQEMVQKASRHYKLCCDWLTVYFGVSIDSIQTLNNAKTMYENDTPSHKIEQVPMTIYNSVHHDYMVLRLFFLSLYRNDSLLIFNLPFNIFLQQIQTAHRIAMTDKGDHLPDDFGTYHFCTNCAELKVMGMYQYIHPTDCRDLMQLYVSNEQETKLLAAMVKDRTRSLCPERVTNDLEEQELFADDNNSSDSDTEEYGYYCGKSTSNTTNIKKRLLPITETEMKTKTKKVIKAYNNKLSNKTKKRELMKKCSKTRLKKINLLGRMISTSSIYGNKTEKSRKILLQCPWCLNVVIYHAKHFDPKTGVFSCGCKRVRNVNYHPCYFCRTVTDTPSFIDGFNENVYPPRFETIAVCPKDNWLIGSMVANGYTLSRIKHNYLLNQQNGPNKPSTSTNKTTTT